MKFVIYSLLAIYAIGYVFCLILGALMAWPEVPRHAFVRFMVRQCVLLLFWPVFVIGLRRIKKRPNSK